MQSNGLQDNGPQGQDPRHLRIQNAQQFIRKNPTETKAVAARIFHLPEQTVYTAVRRSKQPSGKKRKGQGQEKILDKHQMEAIHEFVRSLLSNGILPTHGLVFNGIRTLKLAQDLDFDGPSQRWFKSWWKNNNLHKISTKPLAVIRYSAGQVSDVKIWFDDYRQVLKELKVVNRRNIINFDEAGFRVGCMKKHEILVPTNVREFYAISPENRKSFIIFECIDAAGNYPPPSVLVIQGHDVMSSWFAEGLPQGTLMVASENGFTSDKIALEFLKHYIANSDAGPNAD